MGYNMEEIIANKEVLSKLLSGIDKLANTVKVTLGPSGNTVIIADEYGKPYATKDGVSVSNYIKLKDPVENIGVTMIKEVAKKTAEEAGDGTTTSIVLAQALITNGIKFLNDGGTYNDIKEIYSTLLPKVLNLIKDASTTITADDIVDVATVSANNDREIGELIQVAFNHSTVVKVEEGKAIKDSLELITGVTYPVTYLSKKFITNEAKNTAEVNDAVVLLLGCKLDKLDNLKKVLTYCNKEEKPLLIITEFISDDALHMLETNHINNALKILAVKTPGYANYRNEYIKDLSDLTDSIIIDDLSKMVEVERLGRIKSVTAKSNETVLIPYDDIDIEQRITNLFTLSKQPNLGGYDKKILLERIDNLNGKVSIIKVGAKSEIEMKERYDRIEDAVYAVSSALEEGVLEGGGVALYKIADTLDIDSSKSLHLILQALRAPNKTINENGAKVNPFVFDDYTVVDPTKVTRCALENAASVALTILGTKAVVLNEHLW